MDVFGPELLAPLKHPETDPVETWAWQPAHPDRIEGVPHYLCDAPFVIESERPRVLVIGPCGSYGSGPIIFGLRERGVAFVAIDWDALADSGTLSLVPGTPERGELSIDGRAISLAEVEAVFYTASPVLDKLLQTANHHLELNDYLFAHRWQQTLVELGSALPEVRWFPARPSGLSQQRLTELALAARLGLRTPDTIVTNCPEEARRFVAEHGRVILRESNLSTWNDGERFLFFEVREVTPDSPCWPHIEAAPCIFQAYVEKRYELRVLIIDEVVLACRIDSQASPDSAARMDWRRYDLARVAFTPYQLPTEICSALVTLARRSGLRFASIDIVVDAEGAYTFLEMNRPGNWIFIETYSGLPVLDTLIDALVGEGG